MTDNYEFFCKCCGGMYGEVNGVEFDECDCEE